MHILSCACSLRTSAALGRLGFCSNNGKARLGLRPTTDGVGINNWTNIVFQSTMRPRFYRHAFRTTKSSLSNGCVSRSASPLALLLGMSSFGLVSYWKRYRSFAASCEGNDSDSCVHISRPDASALKEDTQKEPEFPWKEFFKLLWPDVWFLLGAVTSALAVAFLNIQIPLQLGNLVNVLASHTCNENANFTRELREPAFKLMYYYVVQGFLTFIYISLLSAVGERVAARMRRKLFESIIVQDMAFFDANQTGEIVNRLTSDVQDFKSSFKMCVSQGLKNVAQSLGCLVSLFLISPQLTLFMSGTVAGIIAVGSFMGSGLRKLSQLAQAQVSKSTAVANEALGNVRTVKAFAMEPMEAELYGVEVEQSSRLNQLLGVGIGVFQGLSNIALNGIVLGTLYVGGNLMSNNGIKAGDLMSFLVATQTIQRSLGQLSLLFGQAVRGLSSGSRVFEYILRTPRMPVTGGRIIPHNLISGTVEFRGVGFTYPTRPNQTVLSNFSLRIPGGQVVALVGLSGGGKSTVAALLERFYDVDEGCITLDGQDLRALDPSWLRGQVIGYINQEPVLFATTVIENIRYGRPGATDKEVFEAAKLANAHYFIMSFPKGYNTMIGERGMTVSGGQKQRLAIARALIKRPAILILDEATSALDSESERVVQEALERVIKGRTVLVIAHRLSTVRNADCIAVVSNGKIVEIGTHDELKRKGGAYWELIRNQESHRAGENSSSTDGGVNSRSTDGVGFSSSPDGSVNSSSTDGVIFSSSPETDVNSSSTDGGINPRFNDDGVNSRPSHG